MFRSNQVGTPHGLPSEGYADQFTNGGGPAFLNNVFQGGNSAFFAAAATAGTATPTLATPMLATLAATFNGEHRIGHEAALQRSSRAADGTPLHIRMDGTGFDDLDVPDGSRQPKLEFTAFVPTAEFFRVMRVNAASLDLQAQFGVNPLDNGLERFITATRRQNFLCPPRRHRAFPLLELAAGASGSTNAAAPASAQSAPARTVSASTRSAALASPPAPATTGGGSRSGGGSGGGSRGGSGSGGGSRGGGSGGGSRGGGGGGH
jgi:hypothetical protein